MKYVNLTGPPRVATARNRLSLLATFDGVAFLVPSRSKVGGRPPALLRLRRCAFWSSLTGMTAWMPRRRR